MKRGKPLERRTPLVAKSSLRRTPFTSERFPLQRRSKKRRTEDAARTVVLRPLREAQPWCSRCGVTGVGLDAHELLSAARGGSRTDLTNIVLLCRACHDDVTFRHHEIPDADQWILSRGAA